MFTRRTVRVTRARAILAVAAVPMIIGLLPAGMAEAANLVVPCSVGALKAVLTHAKSGDVINLASGCTYTLTTVDNSPDHGLFANGDNGLPVVTQNPITVNGDGATITRAALAPPFRILEVAQGASLNLNNLTIRGGLAQSGPPNPACHPACAPEGFGAGILNGGNMRLTHVAVTGNAAVALEDNGFASGAGIHNLAGATATLTNGSVTNNTSTADGTNGEADGGGISNDSTGVITLNNEQVTANAAKAGGSGGLDLGGGIYNGGTATLNNVTVRNSTATATGNGSAFVHGGGIYNDANATMTLTNSPVSGNVARATSSGPLFAVGGGVSNNGTATLTNSAVTGNRAVATGDGGLGGGGGIENNGTASLTNSAVTGNTAVGSGAGMGGGILSFAGVQSLVNSPVKGNHPDNCFGFTAQGCAP